MENIKKQKEKTAYLTTLGILSALVILLQLVLGAVKFGPVSVTFTLVPIVLGAMVLGRGAGAILGGVFGLITLLNGLTGADGFTTVLLINKPVQTIALCMIKAAAAGYLSGLVYELIKSDKPAKSKAGIVAAVIASMTAPIVNTGIFLIGAEVLVGDVIRTNFSGGENVIKFLVAGIALNFLFEFLICVVFSNALNTVYIAVQKNFNIHKKKFSLKSAAIIFAVFAACIALISVAFFARDSKVEGKYTVGDTVVSENATIYRKGISEYAELPLIKTLEALGASVELEDGTLTVTVNDKTFVLDIDKKSLMEQENEEELIVDPLISEKRDGELYLDSNTVSALLGKLGFKDRVLTVSYSGKSAVISK